jgi:hypothetical protein
MKHYDEHDDRKNKIDWNVLRKLLPRVYLTDGYWVSGGTSSMFFSVISGRSSFDTACHRCGIY